MLDFIENEINLRKETLNGIAENLKNYIYTVSIMLEETLNNGGKVILFEDMGNFYVSNKISDRIIKKFVDIKIGLPAIALKNNELIKEIYGEEGVYQKQIEAFVSKKDFLIGFSSNGCSKAILRALSLGKNIGCRTVGFSGFDGGVMKDFCDLNIVIPSEDVVIIYEMFYITCNIIINSTELKNHE